MSTLISTSCIMFPALMKATSEVNVLVRVSLIFGLFCFIIFSLIVVHQAYIVTKSVPTDPIVTKQRYLKMFSLAFDEQVANDGRPMELYCNVCNVYV